MAWRAGQPLYRAAASGRGTIRSGRRMGSNAGRCCPWNAAVLKMP